MLSELTVHNFAIIQHLEVPFESGLNIVSGETGAGKSILVGAVNLILGSRASQEMIRTGAREAMVEGRFAPQDMRPFQERLEEWGLAPADDIVIRRAINRNGRNRIFINDQTVTLQQLQLLARSLISISGQHEHQLLLDPGIHLDLLDVFGGLEARRLEVSRLHGQWSKTRDELSKLKSLQQEREAQQEWMRFQLSELEAADLQPDEDASLEQERNLLRHAATLMEAAQRAHECLYAERGAVLDRLSEVEKHLQTLAGIDPTQSPLANHLDQAVIHLEELAHALQRYKQGIVFDPQKLAFVEERMALLQRLGKKYGGDVARLLDRIKELRLALGGGEDAGAMEERLKKELESHRGAYLREARSLSKERRECAEKLGAEVEKTLASLDMARARFGIAFNDEANDGGETAPSLFTPTGIDRVEFLLSANPGEDLKPLARIASGGELSRILLALKSLLSLRGEAETLIFDEVDTGIGGRTAELVGLQLQRLAGRHQVICITHLPQIACYGQHHYKVAKHATDGETVTDIQPLSTEERVEELARMLGGVAISDMTRAHAQEFLLRAQKAMGADAQ